MKRSCAVLLGFCLLPGAAADAQSQWHTYQSPDYGFSVRYPSTFKSLSLHPVAQNQEFSMIPICDTTAVACIERPGIRNLQAAGVSVNILRDNKTADACYKSDEQVGPFKPITVHGMNFRTAEFGDAATGHSATGNLYRIFHNDVCFEIVVATAWVDVWTVEDEGPRIGAQTIKRISGELNAILHTFTFTGPVADGPSWSVFYDGGCGSRFEYPSAATVIQTIPWENEAYRTNKISCSEHFIDHGRDYTVAVKSNLADPQIHDVAGSRSAGTHIRKDAWLQSNGYPTISSGQQISATDSVTEYRAGAYYYFVSETDVTILSVAGADHQPLSPANDPVFAHLLRSFQE